MFACCIILHAFCLLIFKEINLKKLAGICMLFFLSIDLKKLIKVVPDSPAYVQKYFIF